MYSYIIWIIVLITLCYMSWIAWLSKSSLSRVDPPLPPGPSGLPIVGSLPSLVGVELPSYFAELSKTYGPIFSLRLGKKIGIVISSPSIAKEVLKDFGEIFGNHYMPAAGRDGGIGIAWTPYGPKWRMLRKLCTREMLGFAKLDATYNIRKHEIHETMLYIQEQAGTVVEIGDRILLESTNVVTRMLWGNTMKVDERDELEPDFRAMVRKMADLIGTPNVSDFFPGVFECFDLQGVLRKIQGCKDRLDDIFEVVIDRCKKIDKVEGGNEDFVQVMMELMKDNASHGDSKSIPMTMVQLKALLIEMIIAGTDTTSNALEFAMAEIVKRPEVMRRAQQELDKVLGSSINTPLEESHILQLPYLQAIMKETLRLHPILPFLVPHTSSLTCVVGGYTIPKDSRILINVWAIHRDPLVWEDPLEFKPERFLDKRYSFSGNDFTYIPFGAGLRICPGIAMAERMFLYTLASMLYYFDWKFPEGVEFDLEAEKFGIPLKMKTPLSLIPSPRSSNLISRNILAKYVQG